MFAGGSLHHWALEAMHAGEYALAEQLFEAAGIRYRAEIAVEPLARLRVHQLISRVRALEHPERASESVIEIERLLSHLDQIESLAPPFELVDAHSLLATWLERDASATADRDSSARRAA
jgi:hypothetical protein